MVGTRSLRPRSHADGRRHYVAEAGIRERFTTTSRPGPSQWVALARALEPQDTALSLFLLVRGQVSRRGEARDPPLTSLSSWRQPLYQAWVKSPTNCSSQTVAHLREGPSASLTNGWASPLTVVQWQLLAWGRSPYSADQWLGRITHGPMATAACKQSGCGGRGLPWSSQSVQSFRPVQLLATPWTAARQACLSITKSRSLHKLMSTESEMPSNHFIFCHPLLLLPSVFPRIRVFSDESVLRIRWPKYWSFTFSVSHSNEHSGLISFRMDWLDLLAVQGTLKSLLQHHSSKASILQCSAFFIVQFSHPYMTTGNTIVLTRRTFAGKVMSLLGWS